MNSKNYFDLVGDKINPLSDLINSGGPLTTGSVLFVKDPSDSDYTTVKDQIGRDNLFDTIPAALTAARSDKNDWVAVCPKDSGAVWELGTALDVSKNRVHLISLGYTPGVHGYTNTLRGFGSAALDTEILNVTGSAVEIAGFRFLGTHGTTDDGTINLVASFAGPNAWVHDCAIETSAVLGGTVARVASGFRADNVWFGNTAGGGAVVIGTNASRVHIKNSLFVVNARVVGDQFLVAGTGATNYVLVEESAMVNMNSGTLVASAVTGSATTLNPILLRNNTYVNVTQAGTDPTVFKSPVTSGTSTAVRDYGIAVGTAALIPV